MKLYELSADGYGDKIKKVYRVRLDLRGTWLEDVVTRCTAVGIWPNRSGWGFGWIDLAQKVTDAEGHIWYEPDDEGNPVIKRRYGLLKVVWEPGELEKMEYRERLELVPGLSEKEVEDAYVTGVAAGLHLPGTLQGDVPFEWKGTYVGWIRAKVEDLDLLTGLGVRGLRIYNKAEGAFEYCEVPDTKTLDRLEKEFPGFWRGSFTFVEEGEQ